MLNLPVEKNWLYGLKEDNYLCFNHLFFNYNKKIYSLARKFKLSHEDAEEIVQEVFIRIWKNRHLINPELSFNAYVFKITQNFILKYFRHKTIQNAYVNYVVTHSKVQEDLVTHLESDNLNSTINNYISKLPDQQKKVFLMSRRDNLSHEEISKKLQISIRTVESHIYKALKFLKQKLSSEEIYLILFLTLINLL